MAVVSAPTGQLHIQVKDDSYFLSTNIPFEVRDARLVVVERGRSGATITVPEGLYSVTVLAPSGYRDTRATRVAAGQTTSVAFESARSVTEDVSAAVAAAVSLQGVKGCSLSSQDRGRWEFVPILPLDSVPTAEFVVGGHRFSLSLPLNPTGQYPLNACTVEVTSHGEETVLLTSFAPERRVASMIDGLVRSSDVGGSTSLTSAARLLQEKYSDPAGAALGGLTLHRLGHLPERENWVKNLARDFGWLPDGSILLAALLLRDSDSAERSRGLKILLTAASRRPMFTDGLSLAIDLLRRWPSHAKEAERHMLPEDERHMLLEELSDYAAFAQWNAINLTVRLNDR